MNVVPCKDCNCRHAECHASCPLYNKWKTEYEIANLTLALEKLEKNKNFDDTLPEGVTLG